MKAAIVWHSLRSSPDWTFAEGLLRGSRFHMNTRRVAGLPAPLLDHNKNVASAAPWHYPGVAARRECWDIARHAAFLLFMQVIPYTYTGSEPCRSDGLGCTTSEAFAISISPLVR